MHFDVLNLQGADPSHCIDVVGSTIGPGSHLGLSVIRWRFSLRNFDWEMAHRGRLRGYARLILARGLTLHGGQSPPSALYDEYSPVIYLAVSVVIRWKYFI